MRSWRRHAPVEDADGGPGQDGGDPVGGGARGGNLPLAFLDRRNDDVNALAGGDPLSGEPVHLVPAGFLAHARQDLAPARGLLIQHRDVQLAVDRPCERARDRRRRHDEHVRCLALAEQAGAVGDAESVLLVHDDEAEPSELHGRLGEGMGAHQHVDAPGRELLEDPAARRSPDAARQERQPHPRRGQPESQALGVLLREDLGRSHERRLNPVARGQHEGEARHDGLAGTDVALEKPRHRAAGAEVGGDLAHGALLRARQGKRDSLPRPLPERLRGQQDDASPRVQPRALFLDARREHQQLLPGENAPGRFGRLRSRREVRVLEGLEDLGRARRGAGERRVEPVEGPPREGAPGAGGNVGHAVVDPHDAARVDGVGFLAIGDELGLRVLDLHLPPGRRGGRPVERRPRAGERLHEGRVAVVPDDADGAGAVVGDGLHPQRAPPHAYGPDAMEAGEDGGGLAPFEGGNRREAPPVFVAKGQREEEIAHGPEPFGPQALGPRGADAGNPGNRIAQPQWNRRGV